MNQFIEYDNSLNVLPDNVTIKSIGKDIEIQTELPYIEKNILGDIISVKWNYKDTFDFHLSINTPITIEETARISEDPGDIPDDDEYDYIGQRFYNLVDITSWEFTKDLTWKKDNIFKYPSNGTKFVNLQPILGDHTVKIKIFNFRAEEVLSKVFSNENDFIFELDSETSKLLIPGNYLLKIYISGDSYLKYVKSIAINITGNVEEHNSITPQYDPEEIIKLIETKIAELKQELSATPLTVDFTDFTGGV